MLLRCGTVWKGGGVTEGTMLLAWLLAVSQSLPPLPIGKLGPSGADSCLGGWVYVSSRTLWVSPTNSLVRLGVSPAAATPTHFYSQKFWGFIFPHWNPALHGLSHSPVVPPSLSSCKCATARSTSCCLASGPLRSGCLFLPLLLVWMNISSLTPWLSDFVTVWFSSSSRYFLILYLLLSFFWLCEQAKCIYLRLHLGRKWADTLTLYIIKKKSSQLYLYHVLDYKIHMILRWKTLKISAS